MENTIRFEDIDGPDETQEIEELDEYTPPPVKYYPSQKVLGKLYRAIDEHKLFMEIQPRRSNDHHGTIRSQLDAVWSYVRAKTVGFLFDHHLAFARDIKEE